MGDTLRYQPAYRRHLPHFQPPGATLFVTFRLADSLPVAMVRRLAHESEVRRQAIQALADDKEREAALYAEHRRQFGRFEALLDHAPCGRAWLRDPRVAGCLATLLRQADGQLYTLDATCIMPNHVHLVMTPLPCAGGYQSLARILHHIKGASALAANRLLEREGAFWQSESYDHVVRTPEELRRIVAYVLLNPVKAGLVATWQEWPWSYSRFGDL